MFRYVQVVHSCCCCNQDWCKQWVNQNRSAAGNKAKKQTKLKGTKTMCRTKWNCRVADTKHTMFYVYCELKYARTHFDAFALWSLSFLHVQKSQKSILHLTCCFTVEINLENLNLDHFLVCKHSCLFSSHITLRTAFLHTLFTVLSSPD